MRNIKIYSFKFFFLVCFSVLCTPYTVLYTYAQDNSKEIEALFVARKAFDDGFYDVSSELLERFINTYPDSSKIIEAELLIGECWFHQNNFLKSLAKFEELSKNPKAKNIQDAIFYWIGEIHFKGNDFAKAAQYYKKIIDGFPDSSYLASSFYSMGWCLFQEAEFKDALSYFKIVQDKFPKDPQAKDASFKILECLYNLKDYAGLKETATSYTAVYSRDDYNLGYLYFYIAEADYYLENFEQAIRGYSSVIEKVEDSKIQALSRLGMAWSYLKLKKYSEAESIFSDIKKESLQRESLDILLLGEAILMSQTNRNSQAKKIYEDLLSSTSDYLLLLQAYLGRADALYNLGDYQEAVQAYKEALENADLKSTPREIIDKLHYNLAWAYLKQGNFKQAIEEFQRIVQQSEDKIFKISALCQIGDTYQDSADFTQAQRIYDKILKEYPDSFYSDYVQYQLGLTFLKVSNYDGAILSFTSLKKNFPNSKLLDDATYALGLAYFQRQDYNSSREIFQNFTHDFKDSPLKPEALYLLGTSFYNLSRYNEAIEVFKNIIRMNSQDKDLIQKAEYEIADCFYQMGNESEAMERFKALRSKYPDSTLSDEIMWWLGEYYYRHNDLVLARRYFSSLIRDFPKSSLVSEAYYILGSSFAEEAKFTQAIENFRKAIELDHTDLAGQASIAIADIYVKQNEFDSAIEEYKRALNLYPNLSGLIYPKLADLFYQADNLGEALKYYRESLNLVPVREMSEIQLKIAEVLEAQGNYEQAVEEYLKVTYLYAKDDNLSLKALLRVAQIYENNNNTKEAVNIYKKVISMDVEEGKFAQERIDIIERRK